MSSVAVRPVRTDAVADGVELLPFLFSAAALEVVGWGLERYGDDSPAFGFVLLPLSLVTFGCWFAYWFYAAFFRDWRRAISRLLGPVAAVVVVAALSHVGWPPWRIAFEFARPYYAYTVWRAEPDAMGRKRMSFLQYDKEMWSGHAMREIAFASDRAPLPGVFHSPTQAGGGCVWTTYVDLHFGFYAHQDISSYVDDCPRSP